MARFAVCASVSALALIIAGDVSAQETATPNAQAGSAAQSPGMASQPAASPSAAQTQEADSTAGVGDIIVTAQKRSESINEVPLSITAATGEDLLNRGVTSTADLAKIVPGLTVAQSPLNVPAYTIRGIGFYETSLSATSTVAVYTDEVPLAFPVMTKAAGLDLERVEVLKGPQGTLFGQNSTGGAINYIAAKPTSDPRAGISGSFGRFATVNLQGYVNTPVSDTLSIRVAASGLLADDWQKSYTRNEENGQQEQYQGRILAQWEPTSSLRFLLNVNGWIDRGDTQAPQLLAVTPQVPAAVSQQVLNYPLSPRTARAADWTPGFPMRNDRFWQVSLRGDFDVTDDITLTSISSYQRFKTASQVDFDALSLETVDTILRGNIKSLYQELRLGGETGPFVWTLGGNYGRDKVSDFQSNLVGDASNVEVIPGLPFDTTTQITQQNITTKAVFGNVEWEVVDGLKIQGAARYTDSKRSFNGCVSGDDNLTGTFTILQSVLNNAIFGVPSFQAIPSGGCLTLGPVGATPQTSFLPGAITGDLNEDNISWRGGITWEPADKTILYANVSRGYKSGSYPTTAAGFAAQFAPVGQESVTAYEAGVKTSLFDRRAQFNAAAFYYDYKGKQFKGKFVDQVFGVLEGLTSIPKSRVWGVEASLQAAPVENLKLSAGATYLNTRITEGQSFTSLGQLVDLRGTRFPYTPKFIFQGDAEYGWNVGGSLRSFVGASVVYNSGTNASLGEDPLFRIKGYTVVDVRAGIEDEVDQWRLSLYGRNVTNTYYWNNVVFGNDTTMRFTGMPVTYGIQFSKQF